MDIEMLFHIHEQMITNHILFTYNGPVSQGIMVEMGSILQRRLAGKQYPVSQKLFAVLVELFQNIMHYSQDTAILRKRRLPVGMILVGETEEHYIIMTGNSIDPAQKQTIEAILMSVNNMDQDELKQFYKNRIHADPEPTSKGGGLGFIDIARKSGYPLEYTFRETDDKFFYSLKVLLDKENTKSFYRQD